MEISSPQLSDLPDIETIRRFFSRVVRNEVLTTEYIDRIQSLYKVEGPLSANQSTLIYFLSQLSKVIDQTSQLEATIELFVERANKYLNSTSEEKWLEYDPDQMRVVVYNNWIPNHIDLNELSSGEKQIVSLLAHLFLYDSKKIILIDEPELSLSIDWQQKILVDIASAPSCQQLLAITHSPFIFDNVLDECAVPLSINRTKSELEADDEF
jgi:predicted ATPase